VIPDAAVEAAANGLNVELAKEIQREIAETAAMFAAAQEAEDLRKKAT